VSAFDVLRTYLEARAEFTDEEFDFIRTTFLSRALRQGEALQRAGEVAKYATFVARGCLRSYVIDSKGKEHVVQFAPETWWLADNVSLSTRSPSQYFFDAIEDSDVLLIDPTSHEALVERIPGYATAFRRGLQRHGAAKDQRIVNNTELDGRRTLPGLSCDISFDCRPSAAMDACFVPGCVA
jgi:CRP-like cAMP-binding protein